MKLTFIVNKETLTENVLKTIESMGGHFHKAPKTREILLDLDVTLTELGLISHERAPLKFSLSSESTNTLFFGLQWIGSYSIESRNDQIVYHVTLSNDNTILKALDQQPKSLKKEEVFNAPQVCKPRVEANNTSGYSLMLQGIFKRKATTDTIDSDAIPSIANIA